MEKEEDFPGKRVFLGREVLFLTPGMVLGLPRRPPGRWTGSSPEESSQDTELPMARNCQGGRTELLTPPGKQGKLWEATGACPGKGEPGKLSVLSKSCWSRRSVEQSGVTAPARVAFPTPAWEWHIHKSTPWDLLVVFPRETRK